MISAWHLLWIIPLSASFGCVIMAILALSSDDDGEGEK